MNEVLEDGMTGAALYDTRLNPSRIESQLPPTPQLKRSEERERTTRPRNVKRVPHEGGGAEHRFGDRIQQPAQAQLQSKVIDGVARRRDAASTHTQVMVIDGDGRRTPLLGIPDADA